MNQQCPTIRELLAAYTFGTLESAEKHRVESHLQSCADCRAQLADYQMIGNGLAHALPPHLPPPRLRARLIAQLARRETKPQPFINWSRFAIAFALLALLILNASSWWQINTLRQQQTALEHSLKSNQAALAIIASPNTRILDIRSDYANGSLALNADLKSGVLLVRGLTPLEADRVYQAWLIKPDGKRVSGGIFRAEGDLTTFVIVSPEPLANFIGVGITVEPAGGSVAPTSPRLFGINF